MARSYQVLADLEDEQIEKAGWIAEKVDEVVSEVPALFKEYRALNRKSKGAETVELGKEMICAFHAHGEGERCVDEGRDLAGMFM